jgi:ribosomal protein S27AE
MTGIFTSTTQNLRSHKWKFISIPSLLCMFSHKVRFILTLPGCSWRLSNWITCPNLGSVLLIFHGERGIFQSELCEKCEQFLNKVINFCIQQQFVGNKPEIVVHAFNNATYPDCLHTQNKLLSLVRPSPLLLSSLLWSLLECPISVRSSGMSFLFTPTVPRLHFFIVKAPKIQRREKNCPHIICDCVLFSSSVLSLWHGLLSTVAPCNVHPSPCTLACFRCS